MGKGGSSEIGIEKIRYGLCRRANEDTKMKKNTNISKKRANKEKELPNFICSYHSRDIHEWDFLLVWIKKTTITIMIIIIILTIIIIVIIYIIIITIVTFKKINWGYIVIWINILC